MTYVITSSSHPTDQTKFYDGSGYALNSRFDSLFVSEYPDAQRYHRESVAIADARALATLLGFAVSVYADYGSDSQRLVAAFA